MRVSRLPLRAGASFKPEHFAAISAAPEPRSAFSRSMPKIIWARVAPLIAQLGFLRENYARFPCMASGLNIGSRGGRWIARTLLG